MDKSKQLHDILRWMGPVDCEVDVNRDSFFLASAAGSMSIALKAIREIYKDELAEIDREMEWSKAGNA